MQIPNVYGVEQAVSQYVDNSTSLIVCSNNTEMELYLNRYHKLFVISRTVEHWLCRCMSQNANKYVQNIFMICYGLSLFYLKIIGFARKSTIFDA